MKEKLFIMLLCFFFFNLNAEIKDTSIKSKLILDSKNYIGDELISKKEFAKNNRKETDPYLSKVMFCLIQNYKQEITDIEKQLAH